MPNSGKPSNKLPGYSKNSPIERVVGYAENVGKEVKQYAKSYAETIDLQNQARTYPPDMRPAIQEKLKAKSQQNDKDLGQVAGAILQGRRYDSKGNRK